MCRNLHTLQRNTLAMWKTHCTLYTRHTCQGQVQRHRRRAAQPPVPAARCRRRVWRAGRGARRPAALLWPRGALAAPPEVPAAAPQPAGAVKRLNATHLLQWLAGPAISCGLLGGGASERLVSSSCDTLGDLQQGCIVGTGCLCYRAASAFDRRDDGRIAAAGAGAGAGRRSAGCGLRTAAACSVQRAGGRAAGRRRIRFHDPPRVTAASQPFTTTQATSTNPQRP